MKRTITNEFGEQVVTMDRSDRGPLTAEELEMIRQLNDFVDEEDEDCPPMPEAMILQMNRDIEARRRQRADSNVNFEVRSSGNAVSAVG